MQTDAHTGDACPLWSAQPPRHGGRQVGTRLLLAGALVTAVAAAAVGLVVQFRPHGQRVGPVADLRSLLVAAPDGTIPCPGDSTMVSVAALGEANALPGEMAPLVQDSGMLGIATRCWFSPGEPAVLVQVLLFDSAAHAARAVSAVGAAPAGRTVAAEAFDLTAVPGGHGLVLPVAGTDPASRVMAVGARGRDAFVVVGSLPSFDVSAVDRIAGEQYRKL